MLYNSIILPEPNLVKLVGANLIVPDGCYEYSADITLQQSEKTCIDTCLVFTTKFLSLICFFFNLLKLSEFDVLTFPRRTTRNRVVDFSWRMIICLNLKDFARCILIVHTFPLTKTTLSSVSSSKPCYILILTKSVLIS